MRIFIALSLIACSSAFVLQTFWNNGNCTSLPNYYFVYNVPKPGVCTPVTTGVWALTTVSATQVYTFSNCSNAACTSCTPFNTAVGGNNCTLLKGAPEFGSYKWSGAFDSALPSASLNGGQIISYAAGCTEFPFRYQFISKSCYPDINEAGDGLADTSAYWNSTGTYHYSGQTCDPTQFTGVDAYDFGSCNGGSTFGDSTTFKAPTDLAAYTPPGTTSTTATLSATKSGGEILKTSIGITMATLLISSLF